MAVERTLSIIKPDATARNQTGAVNALIEKAGLRIIAQKRVRWTQAQAEKFYEVHKARPFYGDLVRFMTSGPIVVQVLQGENEALERALRAHVRWQIVGGHRQGCPGCAMGAEAIGVPERGQG